MTAILLGDSILKNLPQGSLDAIKAKFGLRYLRVCCMGGYTTYDLISKSGEIERLMDHDPHCDLLLLCSINFILEDMIWMQLSVIGHDRALTKPFNTHQSALCCKTLSYECLENVL